MLSESYNEFSTMYSDTTDKFNENDFDEGKIIII